MCLPLSLSEVMSLDVMKGALMVTGGDLANKREVTGIAVIEIPVEDFVKPGQIILTTAMGCGHDAALFTDFAKQIIASRAAALAVAVGRHIDRIPEKAIALANQHQFPIVEMPWETAFSSVIQSVLELIIGEHLAVLRWSEHTHRSLTTVLLEGGSLSRIAKVFSDIVGREVVVLDPRLRILACSASETAFCANGANEPVGTRASATSQPSNKVSIIRGLPGYEKSDVLVAPIVGGGEFFGYFGIVDAGESEWGEREKHALDHASAAAAVYMLRERAIAQTELRLRGDFVWTLAMGRLSDESELARMAEYLGYDLRGRFRGLVFDIEDFKGYLAERGLAEREVVRLRESIRDAIQRVLRKHSVQVMLTDQHGLYICFSEECGGDGEYAGLCRAVQEEVGRQFPGISLACGVGGTCTGLPGFSRSYGEALEALRFGRVLRTKAWVGVFGSLGTMRVLLKACKSEEAAQLVDRFVRPLNEHDSERRSDLLNTLCVMMDCGWNTSKAARALHIHRQTLLYRLDQVRKVGGWDPWDVRDRFSFVMALYISHLAEGRAPFESAIMQPGADGGHEE